MALTVCQTLEQNHLLANVQERGEQLRSGLRAIAQQYPHLIAEVRGWGLINGLELQGDAELTASDVVNAAIAQGLLLVPAGPKVVRLVPPLIVSAAEIQQAIAALSSVFAAY